MEIAISLAVLALIALAVMVVQSRPNRRRRYREEPEWEMIAKIAGDGFEPEAPLHPAAPPPHPKNRTPKAAPIKSAPPKAPPPIQAFPGAKSLPVGKPVSRFWAAVVDEPGGLR